MKLWRLGSILIGLTLAMTACQLKEEPPPKDDTGRPTIPAPADVAAAPPEAIRTASGLAYKVLTVGLGSIHPSAASKVTVHYTGWTAAGKMVDSSILRGSPSTFRLDAVIPGWTEGVQLMVVGEKCRFWIPGPLAYDNSTRKDAARGPLVFEIELIDIQ